MAEISSNVRLRSSDQPLVGRQQVLIQWDKDSGSLLADRARRDLLIITDIRASDSGTYICSGHEGIKAMTEPVLNVGGSGRDDLMFEMLRC